MNSYSDGDLKMSFRMLCRECGSRGWINTRVDIMKKKMEKKTNELVGRTEACDDGDH
jgi:hypothetical protein